MFPSDFVPQLTKALARGQSFHMHRTGLQWMVFRHEPFRVFSTQKSIECTLDRAVYDAPHGRNIPQGVLTRWCGGGSAHIAPHTDGLLLTLSLHARDSPLYAKPMSAGVFADRVYNPQQDPELVAALEVYDAWLARPILWP